MLAQDAIEAIARRIKAAQDQRSRLSPITADRPDFDVESAYAVAQAVHRARITEGARPVGRKLGFTNRNIWDEYGVRQPNWAYLYDRTVVHEPSGHYRCDVARYVEPRIEPEIVFHFASAPPRTDDLGAILESVDWIAHGFEIVQSHFPGWKFEAADTTADAALHGMLLVGEPRPSARLGADLLHSLESFALTLFRNGQAHDLGHGSNVLGSPVAALAHLIALLAEQGREPLAAGEIVTTGTVTHAHPLGAGDVWSTTLQGLALPGMRLEAY